MATPTDRPALSLSQAAEASGKHRNTIRNALINDRFPNAYRDGAGSWRIPVGDLLGAGFTLYAPTAPDAETGAVATPPADDVVDRLRAELAELRRRVELAEALAAERERTMDRLFAMLPALPATASPSRRWPWSRHKP